MIIIIINLIKQRDGQQRCYQENNKRWWNEELDVYNGVISTQYLSTLW